MDNIKQTLKGWQWQSGGNLLLAGVLMVLFAYQGHPSTFIRYVGHWSPFNQDVAYWSQLYRFLFTFLVFFALPVLHISLTGQGSLRNFGLTIGDWRFGLRFVLLFMLLIPVPLYYTTMQSDFLAEYPLWPGASHGFLSFTHWALLYLLYYMGWEFFFRGFMQFSLEEQLKPFMIIMMQTLPSTIIHIGKPEGETLSAIAGGIVFGAVTLRTRSILYPLLAHWYLGCLTELFCAMHGG